MNIWEAAVQTYDANSKIVGIQLDREGYTPLAPIGHLTTNSSIEIAVDTKGNLVYAKAVSKEEPKIVIPVSPGSAKRTSDTAAHGLSEQIGYLSGVDEEKYDCYVQQLTSWSARYPENQTLKAVLAYVKKKTILQDLLDVSLISLNDSPEALLHQGQEITANKLLKKKEYPKTPADKELVRWVLCTESGELKPCWLDQELFRIWTEYVTSTIKEKAVCMVTGELLPVAEKHMKGVVPFYGNAKLISSGDKGGFTFRGIFTEASQAVTVSYEVSQKAHNALRWLVENNGTRVSAGGRTFLCWNPNNAQFYDMSNPSTLDEEEAQFEPIEYKKAVYNKIMSRKQELFEDSDGIMIAMFDAATTGRLAVTYYSELSGSDFVKRMYAWDSSCCWFNGKFGIQSPNLKRLIHNAYGTQRTSNGRTRMEAPDEVMKMQLQRLIDCRLGYAEIPRDLLQSLVNRACCPQNYDEGVWMNMVFCACSVISADIFKKTGENAMSMELNTPDRSFQFGRLLAVMDRVERDWAKKSGVYRDTNAIKSMTTFRKHPLDGFERISKWLETAYLPRTPGWAVKRYRMLVAEIMEILSEYTPEELNKPLGNTFLLGYNLQQNAFFKKNPDKEDAGETAAEQELSSEE